jgi:hypothetical protein
MWESIQNVDEVIYLVSHTGSADLYNLFRLHPERFWPLLYVVAILLENYAWSSQ